MKEILFINEFEIIDVADIPWGTTKQDELFAYVVALNHLKDRVRDYNYYEKKDKNDCEINM